jgi:sugar phosphate isomerase/epimerase
MFVDRLGQWAELAEETGSVISIKPHRGGAMSRPSQAVWIFKQLGNPRWLRMVYDFSHYIFRDMQLEETIRLSEIIESTGIAVLRHRASHLRNHFLRPRTAHYGL